MPSSWPTDLPGIVSRLSGELPDLLESRKRGKWGRYSLIRGGEEVKIEDFTDIISSERICFYPFILNLPFLSGEQGFLEL